MQYLLIAYDGKDPEALSRRMAARDSHIALGNQMRDSKNLLYAAAILNDSGEMIGSVCILDFDSRAKLDDWLKVEPYVTGNVWQKIEIQQCRVGPSFSNLSLSKS